MLRGMAKWGQTSELDKTVKVDSESVWQCFCKKNRYLTKFRKHF